MVMEKGEEIGRIETPRWGVRKEKKQKESVVKWETKRVKEGENEHITRRKR